VLFSQPKDFAARASSGFQTAVRREEEALTMADARELVSELEAGAALADVPDREQLHGYAVIGVPFRSGHILGMRRFPVSSVGPGYTSVWHRDPAGRWVIYQDQVPRYTCPRAFGPGIDDSPTVPIGIEWTESHCFTVGIETEGMRLHWEVPLSENAVTRALNATASILPRFLRHHPVGLAVIGRTAGSLLRAGRVRLTGMAPSRQNFFADLRRIWLIEDSIAVIDGVDLGESGPLLQQAHLADFWLPQRGLFAIGSSFFDLYDPARHEQVASRRELPGATR
jgi:hypothetical protein